MQKNYDTVQPLESKETLVQKELAGIIPPVVRSAVKENIPQLLHSLEQASTEAQEIDIEIPNYRYLSIATNPSLDDETRRRLSAELAMTFGGALTMQGAKESIIIQDSPDFQKKLAQFVIAQYRLLKQEKISAEVAENPFWVACSGVEAAANFKLRMYTPKDDAPPIVSLIEEIEPTQSMLLAAHMAEECMKRPLPLDPQKGELPIILSKSDRNREHGWQGLRHGETKIEAKNKIYKYDIPQLDIADFEAYRAEQSEETHATTSDEEWENTVVEHWDDLFAFFECNTYLRFGQLAERILQNFEGEQSIDFPDSLSVDLKLDPGSPTSLITDVDVSGMTKIFTTLKDDNEMMHDTLQKGSKKLFSRWTKVLAREMGKYGIYVSAVAGDGAKGFHFKDSTQPETQLTAVEYIDLLMSLSSSWDKTLTQVLETNPSFQTAQTSSSVTPGEKLAARLIRQVFGHRVFVKSSLARVPNTLILKKAGDGLVVPFMMNEGEEEMNSIFKTMKDAYPQVTPHSREQFVNDNIRIIGGLNEAVVHEIVEGVQREDVPALLNSGIRLVAVERKGRHVYLLVESLNDPKVLSNLQNRLSSPVYWYDVHNNAWKSPDEY